MKKLRSPEYRGLVDDRLCHLGAKARLNFFRHYVLVKSEGRCVFCGSFLSQDTMHLDHIVPRSLGGGDDFDNIQATCPRCNISKGNRQEPKTYPPVYHIDVEALLAVLPKVRDAS